MDWKEKTNEYHETTEESVFSTIQLELLINYLDLFSI